MPVTTSCKRCTADLEICAWLSQMLGWVSDQINREMEVTRTLMPCPQLILPVFQILPAVACET